MSKAAARVAEMMGWGVGGVVLAVIATPVLLLWVIVVMTYRLLTWPFRLVGRALRRVARAG